MFTIAGFYCHVYSFVTIRSSRRQELFSFNGILPKTPGIKFHKPAAICYGLVSETCELIEINKFFVGSKKTHPSLL